MSVLIVVAEPRYVPPGQQPNALSARQSNPAAGWITIILALLYGASPIDLIWDIIPLIGWTDDFAVITVAALLAIKFFRGRKVAHKQNR